jgi:hypothetical protein
LASRGYDVLFATEPLDNHDGESQSYKEKNIMDAAKKISMDDVRQKRPRKKKKENLQGGFKGSLLETLLGSSSKE